MNKRSVQKTSFTRKLAIVSASLLLVFCILVTIQAVWTHDVALERGKLIAKRLTKIHSDHIELTFNAVDITLNGLAERQYYNSLFGQQITVEVEQDMRKWVQDTPQLAWTLLTDSVGDVVIISSKHQYGSWIDDLESVKQEAFFSQHKNGKANPYGGLSVTLIDSSDGVNENLIILSRSIYNFDGSFGGIAAAAIRAEYFFEFFKSIEVGDKITMAMFIGEDKLVLSSKKAVHEEDVLTLSETDTKILFKSPDEIETMIRSIGNVDYIISSKKVKNLPVLLTLAFDEDQILAGWKSDRMTDLVFLILFTAFGAVLFSLILAMARQIQRAEQSEQIALLANQAKSEFLAKMSHELRTPLNAIIGFSEMIDSGYFGPLNNKKQQERVHDINLCGNHLLQLINDILDYSKGEAGKLELREGEMGVTRIAEESIRMVEEKANSMNITIENELPADFPRIVADERKIKQIMINLLSNAIKFTSEGGKIVIAGERLNGGKIKISVKDSGIGMAAEDIPVALSVFGQVNTKYEVEEEGTGLGLPLCKMLTELHGGQFELESEIGVGTTASMILPKSRIVKKS